MEVEQPQQSQFSILRQYIVQNPHNFVRKLKLQDQSLISIFEETHIAITKYQVDVEIPSDIFKNKISLETVPYSCCPISSTDIIDHYLISSKSMPVRIYQTNKQTNLIDHYGSIVDRKQNSEKYLSPIEIIKKDGIFVGGGHKFLAEYNIQKLNASRYACMDKTNISAVELLGNNEIIAGTFEGGLHFIDRNSRKIVHSMQPHIDAISNILTKEEHLFVTAARKDNFRYLWDRRNLSTFLQCMEYPLEGNQRISIQWLKEGIVSGCEKSSILFWDINLKPEGQTFEQKAFYKQCQQLNLSALNSKNINRQTTINSVVAFNTDTFIFSTGSRKFSMPDDPKTEAHQNIVGIIRRNG